MAFWNETNTEPKRNFRFQVEFTGVNGKFGATDSTLWWAKKITKAKHKGLLREEKGIIRPTPLGYRFLDDLHLMLGPSI